MVATIKKVLPDVRIFVFGSRVNGSFRQYSDLDIVVKGNEIIPLDKISIIQGIFSECDLPYKVDLIDFYRVSEEFKQIMMKRTIEWT